MGRMVIVQNYFTKEKASILQASLAKKYPKFKVSSTKEPKAFAGLDYKITLSKIDSPMPIIISFSIYDRKHVFSSLLELPNSTVSPKYPNRFDKPLKAFKSIADDLMDLYSLV